MYSVSASNKHGPIKLVRRTAEEAFALAMSYRAKGYSDLSVENTFSGEAFDEQQIVANELPKTPPPTAS